MSYRISWKTHVTCLAVSVAVIALVFRQLKSAVFHILSAGFPKNSALLLYCLFFIYIIGVSFTMTLLHEFIHGVFYKAFGGKVKYGFKFVYAYTYETSGIALSKTQFLTVLLSPFTILSLLSLFLGFGLGTITFLFNLLGSTGDMLMAIYLLRLGNNYRIVDRLYGFDVI